MALVEIALFERTAGRARERLIVPSLVGVVEHQTRQVVRVRVDDQNGEDPCDDGASGSPARNGRAPSLDSRRVHAGAGTAPARPGFKELARGVIALIDDSKGELRASWGTGQSGSVTAKRNGNGLIESI